MGKYAMSFLPLGVSARLRICNGVEQCLDDLVDWVGPAEFVFSPMSKVTRKKYFGRRMGNWAWVKRRSPDPIHFMFSHGECVSSIVPLPDGELRVSTELTMRAQLGLLFGSIGGLIGIVGLIPAGAVQLGVLSGAALLILALVRVSYWRLVREFEHLRSALDEVCGLAVTQPGA